MPFPRVHVHGARELADLRIGGASPRRFPTKTAETRLGYPWPPWIGVWAPQGHAALRFDWRGLAVAVATGAVDPAAAYPVELGGLTVYLGRDNAHRPLAAVAGTHRVDVKAQYLGAARQLWAALEADAQLVRGHRISTAGRVWYSRNGQPATWCAAPPVRRRWYPTRRSEKPD